MSRRYTKSEKAAGGTYLLAMLAALAVAAMLSFAFYLYPLLVVAVFLLSRGGHGAAPEIEHSEDYDDERASAKVRRLVAKFDEANRQFDASKVAALESGCDLTKNSGSTRFDPRTRKGKEANRELDNYEAISQQAAEDIQNARNAAREELPDWRADYDRWAGKVAMRKALWNALFVAFVVAGVYRFPGFIQTGFGENMDFLAKKVSVALLWKPEGTLGIEPLFLATLVSYFTFAVCLMVRRVILFNGIDPDTQSSWEDLIQKWSAEGELSFFRYDETEDGDAEGGAEVEFEQNDAPNWREVLEVDLNATVKEIKAAYHHQIKLNHSDQVARMSAKVRQAAETETVKINVAFDAAREELGFR